MVPQKISSKIGEHSKWTRSAKRKWFLVLLYGTCACYAARTAMPLTVSAVSKMEAWNKKEAGTVLSSFFWGYTLTQVLGGYLSDRIGGDIILLIAGLAWSLITFLHPQIIWIFSDHSWSVNTLCLFRVLMGACQGVHFPALASISTRYLNEKQRAGFLATLMAGSSIGCLFTGTIGTFMLRTFGWPSVFYAVGVFSLAWLCIMHHVMKSSHPNRVVVVSVNEELLPVKPQSSRPSDAEPVPWKIYLLSPAVWASILSHTCANYSWFLLLSWLPTYFYESFPGAEDWLFNVLPWLAHIPATIFVAKLSRWMIEKGVAVVTTRKIMECTCQFTQAILFYFITQVNDFHIALLIMCIAVASNAFHVSGSVVNPQDLAPKHAGSIYGLQNMAGAIPGFLGVYLAGFILETTKSWDMVFRLASIMSIFGWYIVWRCFLSRFKFVRELLGTVSDGTPAEEHGVLDIPSKDIPNAHKGYCPNHNQLHLFHE
ncbi:unnamed protein product, partial [Darwinula stevensoni]